MMADVSQELEYQSGRPQQGVLFSAISLSQQLGSGAGHLVAGVGLSLIAFPAQTKDISAIDPSLISGLGLIFMSAGVIGFAGVYAYTRYDLTHARHLETLKSLQERKRMSAEGPSAGESEGPDLASDPV
jgi:Na+/melibiose symporter-like transporter